jgi:hypothetical protein
MNAISKQSDTQVSRPILSPQTFEQLLKFSEFAANSDLMPRDYRGKPANVFLAVQMGSELGLAPMQSLQSIAVINGRPGVWGDGMIGLCRQSPLCEDIREWIEGEGDERVAFCEVKRRGAASPIIGRFSVADAKKASLWSKQGPWTQYPDRMLQNRARGFALRDAFPDLLRGLKSVEELRDTPEEPRPEPKPIATTSTVMRDTARTLPSRAKLDPVAAQQRAAEGLNRMSKEELDAATGGDEITMLPEVDKIAAGAEAIATRYRACVTEDELHAVSGDAQVVKQRLWLAKHRPELDAVIAEAAGERYGELVRAAQEAQAEAAA